MSDEHTDDRKSTLPWSYRAMTHIDLGGRLASVIERLAFLSSAVDGFGGDVVERDEQAGLAGILADIGQIL
jgi:hypothetical protein